MGTAPKPRSTKQIKPDTDAEPLTRLQRMAIDGLAPDFPLIRTPWVIDWLMEVGPTDPGAMGVVPISWGSIEHWQRCIGHDLPLLVAKLLRHLSLEFVVETLRYREPDCPPLWTANYVFNRDEISRKVSNAFWGLIE